MSVHLSTPIKQLTRVGTVTASRLANLGIESVLDLLTHYPARYEDYSARLATNQLAEGLTGTLYGTVSHIESKKTPKKRMQLTEAEVDDGNGTLRIVWFNQPYITQTIKQGDHIAIAGTIEADFNGWVIKNPQFEKVERPSSAIHTSRLVPIYPLTAGLTQKQVRFLAHQALEAVHEIPDILPEHITKAEGLIGVQDAITHIHAPKDSASYLNARTRLGFEELFLIQLLTERARLAVAENSAPPIPFNESATKALVAMLPFDLTNGQRKAAWTILQDMEKSTPMNRLVQGEVGSGKTVVAAIAALNASESGFQTAFMAPTEILALQHYQTITAIFPDRSVALLTSSHARQARPRPSLGAGSLAQTRNEIKQAIAKGHIDITIGTHAIIQQDIAFNKLGLVIVDEQHRFGVAQRKQLKDKSKNDVPHLLSMTATPIPRSLALALYGDLDITSIRELPAGRKPIATRAVDEKHRPKAYGLIRQEIKKGRQAFVICPLVEESDILGAAAATQEYERLKKGVFRDTAIGLLHGKLKAAEKERVMNAFKSGELSILVATSVVEVGVDVPNASIMVIEGADRFGLSQLHQFRGRIGRGEHASYCFLFTDSPSSAARERLQKFVAASDGFEIAELDLQLRGPGKLYGTEQSGRFTDLKIASLTDSGLLERTREAAKKLLAQDPELARHPKLAAELARQARELHFE